jgi:hypothetical protein
MPVSISISGDSPARFAGSIIAIPVADTLELDAASGEIDGALGGAIKNSIESRFFRAGKDEVFYLTGSNGSAARVVLIGMGKVSDRAGSIRRAAAIAARHAMKLGGGDLGFYLGDGDAREVEAATVGILAGAWEYKDLKTPPPENERRQPLAKATILANDNDATKVALASGEAIGAGQSLARTLGFMPGNLCTPDFLAQTARDIAARVASADRWKWIAMTFGLAAAIFAGVGIGMFRQGVRSGVAAGRLDGYASARDEKAAAAWANTPEGRIALGLAKAGSLRELATCSGKGWKRRGTSCVPKCERGTINGWNLPDEDPSGGS